MGKVKHLREFSDEDLRRFYERDEASIEELHRRKKLIGYFLYLMFAVALAGFVFLLARETGRFGDRVSETFTAELNAVVEETTGVIPVDAFYSRGAMTEVVFDSAEEFVANAGSPVYRLESTFDSASGVFVGREYLAPVRGSNYAFTYEESYHFASATASGGSYSLVSISDETAVIRWSDIRNHWAWLHWIVILGGLIAAMVAALSEGYVEDELRALRKSFDELVRELDRRSWSSVA